MGGDGSPMRMVKVWMMVKKVRITTMIRHLETQWVDHMDPEDPGMVTDLKDPNDRGSQWLLSS